MYKSKRETPRSGNREKHGDRDSPLKSEKVQTNGSKKLLKREKVDNQKTKGEILKVSR